MAFVALSAGQCCPHCHNPSYVIQLAAGQLQQLGSPPAALAGTVYHCENCQANFATPGTLTESVSPVQG